MDTDLKRKGGPRIIHLEDDPRDQELIRAGLQSYLQCSVVGARTRVEFLAALEAQTPDVIISDSNLPSFDGLEALALAQRFFPKVPFVFCSGTSSPLMRKVALSHGAKDWVSKHDLEHLANVLKGLCGEAGSSA